MVMLSWPQRVGAQEEKQGWSSKLGHLRVVLGEASSELVGAGSCRRALGPHHSGRAQPYSWGRTQWSWCVLENGQTLNNPSVGYAGPRTPSQWTTSSVSLLSRQKLWWWPEPRGLSQSRPLCSALHSAGINLLEIEKDPAGDRGRSPAYGQSPWPCSPRLDAHCWAQLALQRGCTLEPVPKPPPLHRTQPTPPRPSCSSTS